MLLYHTPCKRRAIYDELVGRKNQMLRHLQLGLRLGSRGAGFFVQCNIAVSRAFAEEDDLDCQIVPELD